MKRGTLMQGIAFSTFSALALTVGVAFFLILFVIVKHGAPVINLQFLFGTPGDIIDQGLQLQLEGTLLVSGLGTLLALAIGFTTAIYLVEYAPKESRFVRVVNVAIANLAGVPAIVFGLFALIFFIDVLGWGFNALTGIIAMSLLELPIIIQASKDALLRVPEGFKIAAYAVGSTKWQAVRHQVLPYAWSGALTGTILALARGIGETAVIIFIGASARITNMAYVWLFTPFSTLSIDLFALVKSFPGTTIPTQWGITFVLIVLTLALNLIATLVRRRFQHKMQAYLGSV